jgi:hypothetical protein
LDGLQLSGKSIDYQCEAAVQWRNHFS